MLNIFIFLFKEIKSYSFIKTKLIMNVDPTIEDFLIRNDKSSLLDDTKYLEPNKVNFKLI